MAETGQDKRSVWETAASGIFSANVSPLGVPDGVREAICRAAGKIDRYPDPLCRKLIQKLGGAFLSGRMDCLWQRGSGSDLSAVSGGKTEKSVC